MVRTVRGENPDPVQHVLLRDPDHRIRVSRIRPRVRDSRPDRASSVRLRAVPDREGLNRTARVPVRASGMLPEAARRASSVRVKTAAREEQARADREEQARAVREDRAREDQVRAVREDRAREDQVRVVREDRAREAMTAADRRATRTEEISAEVLRTGAALQQQGNHRVSRVTRLLYRNLHAM